MMKKLLPLALIAGACEAMAQDAQCVRERAAMVENIQAYARSDLFDKRRTLMDAWATYCAGT